MSEGLRERKKAETRRALSSAALRLADEMGPDGVTVEAIAEAAGVSPRTFFNYFSSKEDAIAGIAPAHSSELLADLVARPEGEPPLEALHAAARAATERLEASADDLMRRRNLFQRYPALAARHAAGYAEVERNLVEEIARRTGLDPNLDIYPALAVATALGAIRVAIAVWYERDRPGPLADVLDEAFEHLTHGLTDPLAADSGASLSAAY
ncbi:MAG TPA: TetR/AcrR family transcriptional regulator [Acidimicrobiales bacterium]